jgi:hypothetical protein
MPRHCVAAEGIDDLAIDMDSALLSADTYAFFLAVRNLNGLLRCNTIALNFDHLTWRCLGPSC